MRRATFWIAAILAVQLIVSLASLPPTPEGHKPLLEGADADERILAILDRACRDCHGSVASYPWYAYVAPGTFLIRNNVKVGREYADFSRWPEYTSVRRQRILSGMANQVASGGMPPEDYLLLHSDAKLTDQERKLLFEWTQSERLRLIQGE